MSRWRFALCCYLVLSWLRPALGGTLAQFRTPFGDIEVELYDQQKPVTVQNFKRLVQSGAYLNTFFHRLEPGFVVQGGGFSTFARSSTSAFAPPWLYLSSVPNFGSITNEFKVGPLLSNTNGTIAMAKTSDPNSANSQFFFNLANNSISLDNTNNSGGFTVFGHVVRDADNVLPLFNIMSTNGNGIVPMGVVYQTDPLATGVFKNLPVTYPGYYLPRYKELVYVDISLLSVQISATNHQREISWNSARGMTNLVEFTTALPPVWRTLVATNGDGTRFTVIDPSPTNAFRFYRVRVY